MAGEHWGKAGWYGQEGQSGEIPLPCICACRAVLEGLWLRYTGVTVEEDVVRERRRRLLQTISWFLLTLLLALFIPDIGKVISVIGGLAACFIFVFPGRASWDAQGPAEVSWPCVLKREGAGWRRRNREVFREGRKCGVTSVSSPTILTGLHAL